MTTTASSDGTPEPQTSGDGGGAAPGGLGGPSGDSGGSQPSATGETQWRRRLDAWRRLPGRVWAIVAQVIGVSPGTSRRRQVVTVFVMVSLALLGVFRDTVVEYFMTKANTTRENDANRDYDASQAPFTVSVQSDDGDPGQEWVMVLDRELTAAETKKLTSSRDAPATFSYLKSIGGRPLAYPAMLEHAPDSYLKRSLKGGVELSDTFKMSVLSTRASAVIINNWEVTDISCRQSSAKTIVVHPPQGEAVYQGIRLHVPPWADEPVLTDDTDGQGEPYFGPHYIEVGGGQSSGGLRVEAIAPRGQSCEWGIKVHYVDAYQKERWIQLKDGKGKPLRIHTESIPLHPRQKWFFGSFPWTPCHLKPKDPSCDLL